MTYNVSGGTLNPTQSISVKRLTYPLYVKLMPVMLSRRWLLIRRRRLTENAVLDKDGRSFFLNL